MNPRKLPMNKILLLIATIGFSITHVWADQPVNSNTVKNVEFDGDYYPSTTIGKYGVILLSGSGGGKLDETAKRIADMGYPVLTLAYFYEDTKVGNLPTSLEMIPLEYFDAPKAWLMDRAETRKDGVIILGVSKGAELSLVLASHDQDYKGVIAVSPSSVVWAGISPDSSSSQSPVSSWSIDGKGVPFIPLKSRDALKKAGLYKLHHLFAASIGNADNVEDALIKVENINSPTLLISSSDDFVWSSNEMASFICSKMNAGDKKLCTHTNFKNGSHTMRMGQTFKSGEILEGQIADVTTEIFKFLKETNE